jgi:hypothetical protein
MYLIALGLFAGHRYMYLICKGLFAAILESAAYGTIRLTYACFGLVPELDTVWQVRA